MPESLAGSHFEEKIDSFPIPARGRRLFVALDPQSDLTILLRERGPIRHPRGREGGRFCGLLIPFRSLDSPWLENGRAHERKGKRAISQGDSPGTARPEGHQAAALVFSSSHLAPTWPTLPHEIMVRAAQTCTS